MGRRKPENARNDVRDFLPVSPETSLVRFSVCIAEGDPDGLPCCAAIFYFSLPSQAPAFYRFVL
jgi:hypothetical protein